MTAHSPVPASTRPRQLGNAILEFALVINLLFLLLLGALDVGMSLGESIQVMQISRDAGHMYARHVDFTLPANQDLIVRLAADLGMSRHGGTGKVILSTVLFVGEPECLAGGLPPPLCPNYNHPVILQRVVIGNPSLPPSRIGEPNPALLDSNGNVTAYLTEPTARATDLELLQLQPGELAYVSEAVFSSTPFSWSLFSDVRHIYTRTIF